MPPVAGVFKPVSQQRALVASHLCLMRVHPINTHFSAVSHLYVSIGSLLDLEFDFMLFPVTYFLAHLLLRVT